MKILIVDDHPLVRKGISSTLSIEKDIDVILEASNIEEALAIIVAEEPTLAIVDLNLASRDGLEIILNCKSKRVKTKFVILTSSVRKEDFARAMEAGVDGYILKDAFAEDILYAIHVVLRGKQFIDPEVISYQTKSSMGINGFDDLTPRESDVLMELGRGLSNNEIAKELFISENTVKKHVSNILSKLELSHRTQIALLVNSAGNF